MVRTSKCNPVPTASCHGLLRSSKFIFALSMYPLADVLASAGHTCPPGLWVLFEANPVNLHACHAGSGKPISATLPTWFRLMHAAAGSTGYSTGLISAHLFADVQQLLATIRKGPPELIMQLCIWLKLPARVKAFEGDGLHMSQPEGCRTHQEGPGYTQCVRAQE